MVGPLPASARTLIDEVRRAFARLAERLPGYELRPSQLVMAEEVARTLAGDGPVLVEAPTGTGKTLAYLVPAVLSGRKVVVSTGTKTLQEQLVGRDLGLLAEHLDVPFRASYLKGRANFLCLRRLDELGRQLFVPPRLPEIVAWSERTATGDRAELDLAEDDPFWRELSSTSETTLARRCPFYESCFTTRLRRIAEEADVVVVNHHLFFADLVVRASFEGAQVIPPYEAVIFDEAHQLEDVATLAFGVVVSSARLASLARHARETLGAAASEGAVGAALVERLVSEVERAGHELFARLAAGLGGGAAATAMVTATAGAPPRVPLPRAWAEERPELRAGLLALDDALAALGERAGHLVEEADAAPVEQRWREPVRKLAERVELLRADLASFQPPLARSHVFWLEQQRRGVALRSSPVEVGPLLSRHLYRHTQALVLTSATLSAAGSFDFVASALGLDTGEEGASTAPDRAIDLQPARQARLESPFDFSEQALLYLPAGLPDPRARGFAERAARVLEPLLEITRGRAFLLFTSYRTLHEVRAYLEPRLRGQVLTQGERPRSQLLDAFRSAASDEDAAWGPVLFATGAFWEGVDVVGPALSLVVIDKLPFQSPSDPVLAARVERLTEQGKSGFRDYQVPQAALALAQGFGRLVRSRRDRGIVAILDRRLTTMPYGRVFLDTLPRCPRTSDLERARAWFLGPSPTRATS